MHEWTGQNRAVFCLPSMTGYGETGQERTGSQALAVTEISAWWGEEFNLE